MFVAMFSNKANAQSLFEIMDDENLNHFEKIEAIENSGLKSATITTEAELKRYNRWRTFWDSRVDSEGQNTTFYHQYNLLHDNTTNTTNSSLPQWQFAGPYEMASTPNYMGRMQAVAIHPLDPNIVYAGSASGGLWRTTNALETNPLNVVWECLTDDYFGMGVYDIAFHPINPDIIYILTNTYANGFINHDGYSLGIYKTTNGGST